MQRATALFVMAACGSTTSHPLELDEATEGVIFFVDDDVRREVIGIDRRGAASFSRRLGTSDEAVALTYFDSLDGRQLLGPLTIDDGPNARNLPTPDQIHVFDADAATWIEASEVPEPLASLRFRPFDAGACAESGCLLDARNVCVVPCPEPPAVDPPEAPSPPEPPDDAPLATGPDDPCETRAADATAMPSDDLQSVLDVVAAGGGGTVGLTAGVYTPAGLHVPPTVALVGFCSAETIIDSVVLLRGSIAHARFVRAAIPEGANAEMMHVSTERVDAFRGMVDLTDVVLTGTTGRPFDISDATLTANRLTVVDAELGAIAIRSAVTLQNVMWSTRQIDEVALGISVDTSTLVITRASMVATRRRRPEHLRGGLIAIQNADAHFTDVSLIGGGITHLGGTLEMERVLVKDAIDTCIFHPEGRTVARHLEIAPSSCHLAGLRAGGAIEGHHLLIDPGGGNAMFLGPEQGVAAEESMLQDVIAVAGAGHGIHLRGGTVLDLERGLSSGDARGVHVGRGSVLMASNLEIVDAPDTGLSVDTESFASVSRFYFHSDGANGLRIEGTTSPDPIGQLEMRGITLSGGFVSGFEVGARIEASGVDLTTMMQRVRYDVDVVFAIDD